MSILYHPFLHFMGPGICHEYWGVMRAEGIKWQHSLDYEGAGLRGERHLVGHSDPSDQGPVAPATAVFFLPVPSAASSNEYEFRFVCFFLFLKAD